MNAPVFQRTTGAARVQIGQGALKGLRQQGSAKAIVLQGPVPEVVFLNTAGGLTGGDRLSYDLTVAGGHVQATTQTAERAYRSASGTARLDVTIKAKSGARVHWLPQETILFENSALARRTQVDLCETAECVVLETLILGRKAMGEAVTRLARRDHRSITRAGRPLMVEPLSLSGGDLAGSALLAGHTTLASLTLAAPGAADALGPVRGALGVEGVLGAASALPGRLSVRLMARDNWPLRRQVLAVLAVLCPGPLPRVWQG